MTIDDDWEDISLPVRSNVTSGVEKSLPVRQKVNGTTGDARQWIADVDSHASKLLKSHKSRIFITNLDPRRLWTAFLDGLPAEKRQEYTCTACRTFVKRAGHLALIDDSGNLVPLFWPTKVPSLYKKAFADNATRFTDAHPVAEYKPDTRLKQEIGKSRTGEWRHLHFSMPSDRCVKPATPGVTTLSTQDAVDMLSRVLSDYSVDTMKQASQILTQHKLPRADNHIGAITWLLDIVNHSRIKKEGTQNLVYRYAATAFPGCLSQLRSGPLSKLLAGLESGTDFKEIKREWESLTAPAKYMRPTVAPTQGNVEASERLFNELGLTASDMRRRFLCVDEVPEHAYIWQRKKPKTELKIFGSVTTSEAKTSDLPPSSISFTKLVTQILPTASKVWVKLEPHKAILFFLTGYEDTKPLMQWHNNSNRVSPYVYIHPKHVSTHGLQANAWNKVHGLVPAPWLWDSETVKTFPLASDADLKENGLQYFQTKNGIKYVFLLDGVYDSSTANLCLFPQWLRGDLQGVRSTIERYSREGKKDVPADIKERGGYVGGVSYGRGSEAKMLVKTEGGKMEGVWEVSCFE